MKNIWMSSIKIQNGLSDICIMNHKFYRNLFQQEYKYMWTYVIP